MRRNSATGNQASGLIRTLLQPPSYSRPTSPTSPIQETYEYYVYCLTRRPYSTTPRSLGVSGKECYRLKIVQGDLDNRASMVRIFEQVKREGGFWGVFVVLHFPGLGVDASGEEKQGKMIADLSLQYGVEAFIYSSAMRLGGKYEQDLKYSARAKIKIEEHVMALEEKGLSWTILQPGFFMDNLEGMKGAIAVSILKKGLKTDSTISFVAAEDVGKLAAAVFKKHEFYRHRSLLVVSSFHTLQEIEADHYIVTGKQLPSAPTVIGWGLNKGSTKTRELMVQGLEDNHKCRTEGDYPNLQQEMDFTRGAYELESYRDWKCRHYLEERGPNSPLASPLSARFRRD